MTLRMWDLEKAVEFCRALSPTLAEVGYAVAIHGSVLIKGASRKDLDLVIFPVTTADQNPLALYAALESFGLVRLVATPDVHARWRRLGSLDEKRVEVWAYGRKRVELFFLS